MNLPALKEVWITTNLAILITVMPSATASLTATGFKPSDAQSNRASALENGIYLYGQTKQPNQIDQGYIVLQNNNGEVVGAAYYPSSEFECFRGTLNSTELEIQSISSEGSTTNRSTTELDDFYQIPVSQNDRRILSLCQQEVKAAKLSLHR